VGLLVFRWRRTVLEEEEVVGGRRRSRFLGRISGRIQREIRRNKWISGQIQPKPTPGRKNKIKIKINLTLKDSSPPQTTSQSPSRPSPKSSKILDSISDLLTAAPRQFSHARPESREVNVSDGWVPSDFRPNLIKHMARIRPY
jgi:hypothetical protein